MINRKKVPAKGHISFISKTPIGEISLKRMGLDLKERFREVGVSVDPQLLPFSAKLSKKRLVFLVQDCPKERLKDFGLMQNGVTTIWSVPVTFILPNLPKEIEPLVEGNLITRITEKGSISITVNTNKEDEDRLIKILLEKGVEVRRKQKPRRGVAIPGCIISIPPKYQDWETRTEETNLTSRDSSEIAKDFILTRINQVQWSKEELQSLAKALSKIGVGLFKTKKATVIPDSEMMVVKMIG